jgi:hypothetical protein
MTDAPPLVGQTFLVTAIHVAEKMVSIAPIARRELVDHRVTITLASLDPIRTLGLEHMTMARVLDPSTFALGMTIDVIPVGPSLGTSS